MNEQLLTAKEVAQQLGFTPTTLAIWRCRCPERLPFLKIGRLVRYRRSDVEKFIAERVTGGTQN